jgi:hypothetical protein
MSATTLLFIIGEAVTAKAVKLRMTNSRINRSWRNSKWTRSSANGFDDSGPPLVLLRQEVRRGSYARFPWTRRLLVLLVLLRQEEHPEKHARMHWTPRRVVREEEERREDPIE